MAGFVIPFNRSSTPRDVGLGGVADWAADWLRERQRDLGRSVAVVLVAVLLVDLRQRADASRQTRGILCTLVFQILSL